MSNHHSDSRDLLGKVNKSQELWVITGDVILLCGSILFKVYGPTVINKSPLLQKLQREQRGRGLVYEGKDVIKVDEKVERFRLLLKVVCISEYRATYFKCVDGTTLLDFMRLVHKYGFEDIMSMSCEKLMDLYPTKLSDWDNVRGLRPDPCLAILLFRELKLPVFLPPAFYQLVTTPFLTRTFNDLSSDDVMTYFSLQHVLTDIWTNFILTEDAVPPTCIDLTCRERWAEFREMNKQKVLTPRQEYIRDPLSDFLFYIRAVMGFKGLCFKERVGAVKRAMCGRMVLWERLFYLFGDPLRQTGERLPGAEGEKPTERPVVPPPVWILTPGGNKQRVN